jgi:CubicO group peptidase (beta-lactamase class C family)
VPDTPQFATQHASPPLDASALLARIDDLAARALDFWCIPGLALAVILPGQETILRTYGIRDIEGGAPVTPRTQFHTCSLTKSMTAAGLLLVLQEQGIPLQTKVRDLLPEFRLSDAVVTGQVNVRDLLCHASGLPRHDRIWTPGDLTRPEMLERLRHLALSKGLREEFQYNNLGYVVLAAIVERLMGETWEAHTARTLLQPLAFGDISFTPAGLEAAEDHAHPHPRKGRGVQRGKPWPAPAPAGGLNAGIEDMAKWLRVLMGQPLPGVPEERMRAVLAQMATPWMYAGTSPHAEIGAFHYGLGIASERYRGMRHLTHGGAMPGWCTFFGFLPDEGAGVVVLTNREGSPVPQLLAFAVYDAVSGREPVDWYSRFASARTDYLAKEEETEREAATAPVRVPARAVQEYVGTYEDVAYGSVQVALVDGELTWSWRGSGGLLKSRGHDRFVFDEPQPRRYIEPPTVTFLDDATGRVDRMAIAMETAVPDIPFRRVASVCSPSPPASPS